MPKLNKVALLLAMLTFTSRTLAADTPLSDITEELCQATPGNCASLRAWCESEESGSKNPGACILINFVKTLSNQALCRKDPSPKECLSYQVGYDAGLQKMITAVYDNTEARQVIDSCTSQYAQGAHELGLNEEKQALLERALAQFEQEFTVPLRMYDSRLVLDCIKVRF